MSARQQSSPSSPSPPLVAARQPPLLQRRRRSAANRLFAFAIVAAVFHLNGGQLESKGACTPALCFAAVADSSSGGSGECFDQQFGGSVADLRSLHTVTRVAVVVPVAAAFYVHAALSDEDADEARLAASGATAAMTRSAEHVRRENGAPLLVHASISSASIEWHAVDLLARRIAIRPLFESSVGAADDEASAISPLLIVTACAYRRFFALSNNRLLNRPLVCRHSQHLSRRPTVCC